MYICDFGIDIDGRIMFWVLTQPWLKGTLWKELKKLSVTKIYSVGFNRDTDFDADHDAEILCKRITQSD